MHKTHLDANWRFHLLSQIIRGKFLMRPDLAIGFGTQLATILNNRDWDRLQTEDLENSAKRAGLPISASDGEGGQYSVYDDAPKGSTAIIPLKGSMMKYSTLCQYGTLEIAQYLREAANHPNISSIVLDVDSGGGAVDAVAPIVQAIRQAKQLKKPVVASVDMACSAAYWAASECDYIIADNNISAEVGSIGVVCSFMDVQPYWEEMGIKFHSIYPPESSEKHASFNLALEGNYDKMIEEELSPLARQFQQAIRDNRKGKLKEDKYVLAGKTYLSDQGLVVGLIDEVGDVDRALQIAQVKSKANSFFK